MKLTYKGKFDGKEENLPGREHEPGYVPFKEVENMKQLGLLANGIAMVIFIVLMAFSVGYSLKIAGSERVLENMRKPLALMAACWVPIMLLFPHEIIHALCFKEEVFLYTNLKQGMLFVMGLENMTKARFIFLSLAPNLLFGFIPFIIYLFNPQWLPLALFSRVNLSAGAGDYYNVFNCATQVPKGGMVYMSQAKSYWYMPEK